MTNYEVLLILLEESLKYEYETAFIKTVDGWKTLAEVDILQTELYRTSHLNSRMYYVLGSTINMEGCTIPKSISSERITYITVGKMTTSFCPKTRTIYISYKTT